MHMADSCNRLVTVDMLRVARPQPWRYCVTARGQPLCGGGWSALHGSE